MSIRHEPKAATAHALSPFFITALAAVVILAVVGVLVANL